jgi:hypothetical protein
MRLVNLVDVSKGGRYINPAQVVSVHSEPAGANSSTQVSIVTLASGDALRVTASTSEVIKALGATLDYPKTVGVG